MGDFTETEIRALMAQHTEETGQRFTAAAQEAVWTQTCGQPWLVKVLRDSDRKSLAWTVEEGVKQTLGYTAQCGAEEGHLVVIDRRSETRRRGDGEADGSERQREGEEARSGRREDSRGVVVWTL